MATRSNNTRSALLSSVADTPAPELSLAPDAVTAAIEAAEDALRANLPAVIPTIAAEIGNIRHHSGKVEDAVAALALAIVAVWDRRFIAVLGKSEDAERIDFGFPDLYTPRRHEDGKEKGLYQAATYVTLAEAFNVPEGFLQKDKQHWLRAWKIAASLMVGGMAPTWTDAGVSYRADQVHVMSELRMVAEKDAEGKPIEVERDVPTELGAATAAKIKAGAEAAGFPVTDEEALEKAKAHPVTLGKPNALLGVKAPPASEFADKVITPVLVAAKAITVKPRTPRPDTDSDKGKAFGECAAFVDKIVTEWLDETNDAPSVDLSDDLLKVVAALHAKLGAFCQSLGSDEGDVA